tara:strand:+ start:135 stop:1121 length:987 start_codon:yes stop_codon:yes gene_type:complete
MEQMKGFSNRFTDFPNYILEITKEIWEGRGLSTLNHYYSDNIPMRFPEGISIGNQQTINGTLSTLAEFPDRELTGEDVIWSGNDDDGFLSSHRLLTSGTHIGGGYFGPPTGKKFVIRAIADCAAINNQINDEWLIRDTAGLVKQLGLDPKQFARDLISREGGVKDCLKPFCPAIDIEGPYKGRGNDNEWGERLSDVLSRMMNKDFSVIGKEYDRAVQTEHPGSTTVHSWAETEKLWMGLRASFPNAKFTIEHQIGREDPLLSPRAAVRWALHGKHDGWGMFGQPTGSEIYVMGFTHAEFGPYGLRREYTLFDHVSIWKQIFMATGAFE